MSGQVLPPIPAFQEFIHRMNSHDVDKIAAMMTDDHTLVDARGSSFSGKDVVRKVWTGYFRRFPDYKIELDDIFEKENVVVGVGHAGASYLGQRDIVEDTWLIPAAWKAVVEGGKIKLWEVYSDTKIPSDIVERKR